MLKKMIDSGFGNELDLNCAEKIFYGANQVYGLNFEEDVLKTAAGFGGGMGIESVCGALTGGVMILGKIFVENVAHQSNIKEITTQFLEAFEKEMGSLHCAALKKDYRTEEMKCHHVIVKAAEVLDKIILENKCRV